MEELERELSVWKGAFKTADSDRKLFHKTVLKLERNIGALKVCVPVKRLCPTTLPTQSVLLLPPNRL